jgi:isocitrate/isopropylmalate dehydrogenase
MSIIRPVKLLRGVESPLRNKDHKDIDFIVIRENNEGEFVQNGKILRPESPEGVATGYKHVYEERNRAYSPLQFSTGYEKAKESYKCHQIQYTNSQPGLLGYGYQGSI